MSGYYDKYLKYKQKYVQLKAEQFLRNPIDQGKYLYLKNQEFNRNPMDQGKYLDLKNDKYVKLFGGNENKKSKAVFLLGGPGCGKGTNAEKIVRDFGYIHLSAGDLLREERNNPNSKQGELINSFMKEGKLVPPEIPTQLLKNKMEELKKSGKMKFLIDGFPRSMLNLEFWNNIIGDLVDIDFVLFLNCFDDIMIDRALERGRNSGRVDDNIDTLRKRLETYKNESLPVIEYFREKGIIEEINSNRSKEEVYADIAKILDRRL